MPRGRVKVYLYSVFNFSSRRGWVVNTPWLSYHWDRLGTICIEGWVGPMAGLDWCGISRHHRDSIHRLFVP